MGPIQLPGPGFFIFALIGVLCAAGTSLWLAYHVARALLFYVGWL